MPAAASNRLTAISPPFRAVQSRAVGGRDRQRPNVRRLRVGIGRRLPRERSATQVADDPASSPYSIWNMYEAYNKGSKVVWHRNVYEAKRARPRPTGYAGGHRDRPLDADRAGAAR